MTGSVSHDRVQFAVVGRNFALYREKLFELLSASELLDVHFVGDPLDRKEVPNPSMDLELLSSFEEARSYRLPFGASWQRGVIRFSATTDKRAVSFEGDPHLIATWIAALVLRARNRRVIFWTQGWRRIDVGPKKWLRNAFYRLADSLMLYSTEGRALGIEQGFAPSRLHVVYNSMGAPILPARGPSGDRSKNQKWVIVSRLIERRRFDEVLRQIARLRSSGRHVKLIIVGEGPTLPALKKLDRELGLGCEFWGAVYDEERASALLREQDILLSPGDVGLAAVHSLSSGCPVATHGSIEKQNPEFAVVIDGVSGVLFPEGDFRAMADSAWSFVASTDRQHVSEQCNEIIRDNWTPERHASAIEAAVMRTVGQ